MSSQQNRLERPLFVAVGLLLLSFLTADDTRDDDSFLPRALATSVEEIQRRIGNDALPSSYPPRRLTSCLAEGSAGLPAGAPKYTTDVHTGRRNTELSVTFWVMHADEVRQQSDHARRAGSRCRENNQSGGSADGSVDTATVPAALGVAGWAGNMLIELGRRAEEHAWYGEAVTELSVVAGRGPVLAEVSWETRRSDWPLFSRWNTPDSEWPAEGRAEIARLLRRIGGDPASDPPQRPDRDAISTTLARHLPPLTTYSPDAAVTTVHEWEDEPASDWYPEPFASQFMVPAGHPTIERVITGTVRAREAAYVTSDPAAAREVRKRLESHDDWSLCESCHEEHDTMPQPSLDVVPEREQTLGHKRWEGSITSAAVRIAPADGQAPSEQAAARVTVIASNGPVVLYLDWNGPAGNDLSTAVERGQETLWEVMDALVPPGGDVKPRRGCFLCIPGFTPKRPSPGPSSGLPSPTG